MLPAEVERSSLRKSIPHLPDTVPGTADEEPGWNLLAHGAPRRETNKFNTVHKVGYNCPSQVA